MITHADIDGYFSFEPFYNHIAENVLKDGMVIAEIGAFKGKSTSFMAQKIRDKKLDVKFYAIDHWEGSSEHKYFSDIKYLYRIFLRNMIKAEVLDYVTPIRNTSVEAAKLFPDKHFDFVFIDASHEEEFVTEDIYSWLPKVKSGGILGGDDLPWVGVKTAVSKIFSAGFEKDFQPAWYVKL